MSDQLVAETAADTTHSKYKRCPLGDLNPQFEQ